MIKNLDPGIDVRIGWNPITIAYGPGVFGPEPEYRRLRDIRPSLQDPCCEGPDPVYGIAMDVGRESHREALQRRHLLFGVVAFAAGRLGREPVRSQGHVHKTAAHSGWSAPELFEIWSGRAMIYMQESVADNPGRCFAIDAGVGDKVVVPPGWAHAVISADPKHPLVFAAWCERDYGFVYDGVRTHGGLAWFPECAFDGIRWQANPRYSAAGIEVRRARSYPELGLRDGLPLYLHFGEDATSIEWIAFPDRHSDRWPEFEP
jgi:glucose-6-phosphate isomerase